MSETEGSKDLFGKIDALFEKRSPDALIDKGLEHEDFPLLTDVIAPPESPALAPEPELAPVSETVASPAQASPESSDQPVVFGEPERRVWERRRQDRRGEERRLGDRREENQPEKPPRPLSSKEEVDRLVQSMELRLQDLFIRQQLRMEEALRRVIREEIEKGLTSSADTAGEK